jgi:hypothetical protein
MNIQLQLPKDINSVNLRDFQKFQKVVADNPEVNNDFLEIKMLQIFAGLTYKEVQLLPVGTFDDVMRYMTILFESKTPLIRRFTMTGTDGVDVEFGFIPNLDKMTMGEYIDLNNYLEDADSLNKAMAVLYRPIHPSYKNKTNYRISSYEGTEFFSELMKDMPLGIALGAKVFFYRLGMKLSRLIMNSFQRQLESQEDKLSEEEKSRLIKSIDGIKSSTLLLEDRLSILTKQPYSQYTKQ